MDYFEGVSNDIIKDENITSTLMKLLDGIYESLSLYFSAPYCDYEDDTPLYKVVPKSYYKPNKIEQDLLDLIGNYTKNTTKMINFDYTFNNLNYYDYINTIFDSSFIDRFKEEINQYEIPTEDLTEMPIIL